jgi:hypothetical protein
MAEKMKKGELRHIRIEPSENGGAVVTVHKKQTSAKAQKGPWLSDSTEEIHTHPTPQAAGVHVKSLLEQHFDKAAPAASDRAADKKQWGSKTATGKSEPISDDGPDAQQA